MKSSFHSFLTEITEKSSPKYIVNFPFSRSSSMAVMDLMGILLLMMPNCVMRFVSSTTYCDLIKIDIKITMHSKQTKITKGFRNASVMPLIPSLMIRKIDSVMPTTHKINAKMQSATVIFPSLKGNR